MAEDRNFRIIASAALVAQHSIAVEVAKGRPDEQDRESILTFAKKVLDKIESGSQRKRIFCIKAGKGYL